MIKLKRIITKLTISLLISTAYILGYIVAMIYFGGANSDDCFVRFVVSLIISYLTQNDNITKINYKQIESEHTYTEFWHSGE